MKRSVNFLLCVLMQLGLSNCEEVVYTDQLTQYSRKVVINSMISPDQEVVEVDLTYSNPSLGEVSEGNSFEIIQNATVYLNDGSNTVELLYNDKSLTYQIDFTDFNIVTGKTYSLEILVEGKKYSAKTTVPKAIQDFNIQTSNQQNIDYNRHLSVFWEDPAEEINFYHIKAKLGETDWINPYFFESDELLSDKLFNGSTASATGKLYAYGSGDTHQGEVVTVDLLSVSEEYFKYQKILSTYTYDDPFSEPVQLYSNIEGGGLGIFASYSTTVKEFIIN